MRSCRSRRTQRAWPTPTGNPSFSTHVKPVSKRLMERTVSKCHTCRNRQRSAGLSCPTRFLHIHENRVQFSRNPSEPGSSRDHARWYLHVCPPLRDVRNGERAHPTSKSSVIIIVATRLPGQAFLFGGRESLRICSSRHFMATQRGGRPRCMS